MVEKRSKEPTTREYTINLHKRLHGINFKKRAPRAVKEVRLFASKVMGTKDVRLDVKLNKEIWRKGIKNVPFRLRLQISRRYGCFDALSRVGALRYVTGAAQRLRRWQHAHVMRDGYAGNYRVRTYMLISTCALVRWKPGSEKQQPLNAGGEQR
jgi:ribosomal protein L31E